MKILVLLKECLFLERGFEINDGRIDDRYFNSEMNDWDEHALEEAVQISEDQDDVEIVAATIGPFHSVTTIKRGLSHGVDQAIRIWDDELDEYGMISPQVTARILEKVVEEEEPDLVLAGAQSEDDAFGATPVLLAEYIDYNWAAVVDDVELDDDSATVSRELEGGLRETVDVDLPAVISVQSGINEPRYVSQRSMYRQSGDDSVSKMDFDELGLEPSETSADVELQQIAKPQQSAETTYLDGGTTEEASQLVEVFQAERVIE